MSTLQSYDSIESGATTPNPLIPLTFNERGNQAVSARVLHSFLKIKRDFTTWCKQMFDYGFSEGEDFAMVYVTRNGDVDNQAFRYTASKRSMLGISIDYILSLDCAKEIAMVQRSERGRQARRYFIECEKQLKELLLASKMPCIEGLVRLTNDLIDRVIGLEGKIERMHKAREEYFAAKEVNIDFEQKNRRDVLMGMMTVLIRRSLGLTWAKFWDNFERQYAIDVRALEHKPGEHTLDVAIRNGHYGRVYEMMNFQ